MSDKELAILFAKAVDSKKGLDILILDLKNFNFIVDYFVIVSGTSDTHVRALADTIEFELEENGLRLMHRESDKISNWILMDCGNIIVHIFHKDLRKFYALERIWGDAKLIEI